MAEAAPNPYITAPTNCALTTQTKGNIPTVHIISIDSYPNTALKFLKHVNYDIQLPKTSYVAPKYCNPHSSYVMASVLGVNTKGIPAYANIKVTYLPAITCIGSAIETDLTVALQTAKTIATANAAAGINTVVSYPIAGAYNSAPKIQAMQALANTPRTYVMISAGNYEQEDFCGTGPENIPNVYVIGASAGGDQLSKYGNIGGCVRFYTPGRYKSVVDQKVIWGTSFSMPVAANIFINMLLAHPDLMPEDIYARVLANAKVVTAKATNGTNVDIRVFPKKTACATNTAPLLAQFNASRQQSYEGATEVSSAAQDCGCGSRLKA